MPQQHKQNRILTKAIELFREQGFRGTTMQQIADSCDISKGALYLVFSSKQDLVRAILAHLSEEMMSDIEKIRRRKDLDARQRFEAHIAYQFVTLKDQQALTEMLLFDTGFALDEEIMLLTRKLHADWQFVFETFVTDLYGEQAKQRLNDLSVIIMGTINEIYSQIMLHGIQVDPDTTATFIYELTDHLMQSFLIERAPFIESMGIPSPQDVQAQIEEQTLERARAQLTELKTVLDDMDPESELADAQATYAMLVEATQATPVNRVLIQALLANLRVHPKFQSIRRELAFIYRVKLV